MYLTFFDITLNKIKDTHHIRRTISPYTHIGQCLFLLFFINRIFLKGFFFFLLCSVHPLFNKKRRVFNCYLDFIGCLCRDCMKIKRKKVRLDFRLIIWRYLFSFWFILEIGECYQKTSAYCIKNLITKQQQQKREKYVLYKLFCPSIDPLL